jgi:hypothetical protein
LVLLVGCVAEAGDGELDDGAEYASQMTAAESARVLALVNYPLADRATLDGGAGLTAQAAKSIAQYRAGADGVFPSKDDNEIDGIPELDAIPNVGAATLQRLLAYATAHPRLRDNASGSAARRRRLAPLLRLAGGGDRLGGQRRRGRRVQRPPR